MSGLAVIAVGDGTTAKDLLAPIAAVCGAAIAAIAAWHNGRITPSDRLQALIAIYKDWPDDVPGRTTLGKLIRGQLGEMWHQLPHLRGRAPTDPACADIRRAGTGHLLLDIAALVVRTGAAILSAWITWPIDQAQDVEIIVASLIGGVAVFVASTRVVRIVRHWL